MVKMAISSKRRRSRSNNMITSRHHLPEEVIEEILVRLPFKSIFRFQCVCKSWLNLIKDSRLICNHLMETDVSFIPFCFIHNSKDSNLSLSLFLFHHDHDDEECASWVKRLTRFRKGVGRWLDMGMLCDSAKPDTQYPLPLLNFKLPSSTTPSDLELVGNCNGIMCFSHSKFILLVNPLLKEVKTLPIPNPIDGMPCLVGFGFDDIKTMDFKLVGLYNYGNCDCYRQRAEVYNLKTNVWRKSALPFKILSCIERSTFLNGVIYWCAEAKVAESYGWKMLSFNMATELFELIDLPPNLHKLTELSPPIRLFVMNHDSLALVNYTSSLSTPTAGVWRMNKHEETTTTTWTQLCSIKDMPPRFDKPISFWKKDKLLCETKDGGLILYDVRRGRWSLVSDYSLVTQHQFDYGSEVCLKVEAGILRGSSLVSMNM